jgi:sarcosine oxidase
VVVVGCGAAGLAVAAELAGRGQRVVGLERFDWGHTRGSSHGTERIVRVAYADAVHADMAVRSIDGWRRLERDAAVTLLTPTGGLDIGGPDEIDLLAIQCERVGVPTERLSAAESNVRFPMFRFAGGTGDGEDAQVLHHPASTVHAERALRALRSVAERRGATFRSGVRVVGVDPVDDDTVVVRYEGGAMTASRCVVTVGAWAGENLVRSAVGDARLPTLTVTQEQVGYFRPRAGGSWPTFVDRSEPCVYGLPTPAGLVKIGEHHTGEMIDVELKSDELEQVKWQRLQRWVGEHVPGVDPVPVESATCLYAWYPGDTFLFDRIGPIVLGLGLSGHGFKFVPEVGRRLADLIEGAEVGENPFSLERPMLDVGASGRR